MSSSRKRQRVGSSSRLSSLSTTPSTPSTPSSPVPIETLTTPASSSSFNDPSTADVLLRLHLEHSSPPSSLDLHLHSSFLRRSRYFDTLLSPPWLPTPSSSLPLLSLDIPSSFHAYVSVLRLLYSPDLNNISSASSALSLLPPSLHLLFDDLISACVLFLEAVPWTEAEEDQLQSLLPSLPQHHSLLLLPRFLPLDPSDMLFSLVQSHPMLAKVKAFVAALLRDYSPKSSVHDALNRAFLDGLVSVCSRMADYASPDFRFSEDDNETEAMQRLNLYTAGTNTRHLLWLVERMIELRVADAAAQEWANQTDLAADLQKAIRDDASWRNIAPGLPSSVMRCTALLAGSVASGNILFPRQLRMKLVKTWLPVLNVCRESPSRHKVLYQELEETFLKIISTLPLSDAQELLQECLSFSTHNVDDCPHLVGAFKTWFRRANRPPPDASAD